MTRALWNKQVIAQSDDTILVEGNHYFPRDSVADRFLRKSEHGTWCSWKGQASYFDIVVDGNVNHAAAWHYGDPYPAAAQIRGMVAFWRGVEILDED